MKRVIDTIEVLGTVDLPEGTRELCATANAEFDEVHRKLVIRLESFLRTMDIRTKEKRFVPDWLPKAENISESVDSDEALEMAREIFQRWTRRVRNAAPSLHSPTF